MKKAEVEKVLESYRREVGADRVLISALLAGEAPYLKQDVNFFGSEPSDVRECWSLYRPQIACGGVILIEQFDGEKRLWWRVIMGCGEEFTDLVNGKGGFGRADLARKCMQAQIDS